MHEKPTASEIESVLALAERIRLLKKEFTAIQKKLIESSDSEYDAVEREIKVEREAYSLKHTLLSKEYKLSPDEMRLVIEYKKTKSGPERQLNCRVFEDISSDEFREYLKSIIESGVDGQRFQVVIGNSKGNSVHWSAADILVDKEGIRVLHFDALVSRSAEFKKGGKNGQNLQNVLKGLESSKPISFVDAYMQVDGEIVDLQVDSRSCSLFAMATALDLSKIPNLHELAKAHAVRFEVSPVENNVRRYSIDAIYLPASFVRNSQSRALTEYYDQHQPEALKIIPRKGGPKKLKEYVDSRSHKTSDAEKLQNLGVMHSREHYKKIVGETNQENKPKNDEGGLKKK